MRINACAATDGVRWVTQGLRLLVRQPLGLPAMTVIYFFMHMLVIFGAVGVIITAVVSPFAVLGLMGACREIAAGRMPTPAVYITPFKEPGQRKRLLQLGAANAALIVVVSLLILLAGVGELIQVDGSKAPTMADIDWDNVRWGNVIGVLLLTAPILLLMWFAPMLAGWHGAGPGKAMFGSLVACWRNMSAMLVFGLAVSAVILAAATVLGVLLGLLGSSKELISILFAPASLVLLAVVQAGTYAMYTAVIGES